MSTETNWYVYRGQQQWGPYSWQQMVEMAQKGNVGPTDRLWHPEYPNFVNADRVPGLFQASTQSTSTPSLAIRAGNQMQCPNCGTTLANAASFCWKCGKPQKSDNKQDEAKWEYDDLGFEVNFEMGSTGKFVSYADIVQHTWSEIRPQVYENIQPFLDEGWELVTPLSSDCMVVATRNGGFFRGTKVYLKGVRIKMRRRRN